MKNNRTFRFKFVERSDNLYFYIHAFMLTLSDLYSINKTKAEFLQYSKYFYIKLFVY